MSLAALQREFTAFLRNDGVSELSLVAPRSQRGLPVYHYAYRASLASALRDVYERVLLWMGDELFDAAAAQHITARPPASWTLADFGADFEATLALCHPDHPELRELAWLDWHLRAAFNGPDAPPLDPATLASADWDNDRLHLAPTLALRPIETNVAPIWRALDTDPESEPPVAELLDHGAVLTVWRHELMPRFHVISPEEAAALESAQRGESFGAICERLSNADHCMDDAAARAGAMLQRWIAEGVLVGFG